MQQAAQMAALEVPLAKGWVVEVFGLAVDLDPFALIKA